MLFRDQLGVLLLGGDIRLIIDALAFIQISRQKLHSENCLEIWGNANHLGMSLFFNLRNFRPFHELITFKNELFIAQHSCCAFNTRPLDCISGWFNDRFLQLELNLSF